ncbi:hypothetical protein O9992_10465 [Vibrio lentus]|nr:hypothetical protein [Vibrio lentus]
MAATLSQIFLTEAGKRLFIAPAWLISPIPLIPSPALIYFISKRSLLSLLPLILPNNHEGDTFDSVVNSRPCWIQPLALV